MFQVMSLMTFFCFTTSLLAVTGQVQAKPTGRFGVVDMQNVILNVEEGKSERAKLEKEIKAKEQELMTKKKELDKLNEEWKSQAALLSEAARLKKQQEFQEMFLGLRNAEMTFQNEIKRKEQVATQKIAVEVAKIVEKMSKEGGFEAVFETNTAGLLYLKDPVDLTPEVIKVYEAETKDRKNVAKQTEKSEKKK